MSVCVCHEAFTQSVMVMLFVCVCVCVPAAMSLVLSSCPYRSERSTEAFSLLAAFSSITSVSSTCTIWSEGRKGGAPLIILTMYIILYRSAHNSVLVSALLSDLRTDTHIKFQKATQYIEMKPTKQCSRKCHDNNNMHN